MPRSKREKHKRFHLPVRHIRHTLRHLAHHRGGASGAPERLEIQVQFDLNIEEGEDAVSDETLGDIQQEVREILEEGGAAMADMARGIAPFRTGALMNSIYYRVEDVEGLALGAAISYAPYVEWGNSRSPPHPFLQPALAEYHPMIQEEIDQVIADHMAEDSSEDDPEFEFNTEMEFQEAAAAA